MREIEFERFANPNLHATIEAETRARVAYYKRHEQAEREFSAHARQAMASKGMDPEDWERELLRRTKIRDMTDEIAARLESAGKLAWRQTAYCLGRYHVMSKVLQEVPQYRRICLLPYVAAIVRASKLAALEYFLQRHRFCRFWTFTSGARCGLEELPRRVAYLNRKLSRLSAFLRERFGVEIIFRSDEFGTVEFAENGEVQGGSIEFGADGEPLFHVHAHVVVHSLVGFIPPRRWEEMIRAVWEFWSHNWEADGIIRDARECCKYVTKPGDVLKLSPEQLGRFHTLLYRKKLVQPMGTLAEEIRARKKAKKILRLYKRKDGTSYWKEVFNHNEHVPLSEEEREHADNYADAEAFKEELHAANRVNVAAERAHAEQGVVSSWLMKEADGSTRVVHEKGHVAYHGVEFRKPEREKSFCRVLSRLSPSIGPTGRREPSVLVSFSRWDAAKIDAHPLVERLWAETATFWANGLGAERSEAISVHTVTPTVPVFPDLLTGPEAVDPPPDV